MLEAMESMFYLSVLRCYSEETVLWLRAVFYMLEVLERMLCVLRLLAGVRRILRPREIVYCRCWRLFSRCLRC